jgi:hypothetical protein
MIVSDELWRVWDEVVVAYFKIFLLRVIDSYLTSLFQLHKVCSNEWCEISGSHGGEYEDESLLGYWVV